MTTYQNEQPSAGTQIGNAIGAVGERVAFGGAVVLGIRAGQNRYAVSGDLQDAIWFGAKAARRWMTWFVSLALWIIAAIIVGVAYMVTHDVGCSNQVGSCQYVDRGFSPDFHYAIFWMTVGFLFTIGVTYTRNIDSSLFSRNPVYWVFRPVAFLVAWVPSFFLYVLVFVPAFIWLPTP